MIKPVELETADGRDIWDTIVAASAGDVATLRRLLERDPRLARAKYGTRRQRISRRAKGTSKRCASCSTRVRIPSGTG